MKNIKTPSYIKVEAKKKEKKSEDWDPNPWAVCHAKLGPEKTEKFERCVQHVKEKQE